MSDERLTLDERRATMSFVASDTGAPAPSGPRLDPGATLAGRYRVVRFIAEGGTGEVYEAHDTLLDDRIALKVLRGDVSHHATTIERFRREISLAHKVTHPNVCRLFEIGQDGAVAYLTMELLDGESLSARLDRVGRLSTDDALPIVRALANGLGAAHAAGIIHRDFKSQNVILVGERAVVTDFGLARCAKDHDPTLTGAGVLVGTPAYMAPEQVEGGELTTRTDIYAFGVVLFELVTGRLPFIGASPLATAILRIKGAAPRARSIVPALDARWDATIARCLAADPAERFATVEEVVAALTGPMPSLSRAVGTARRTFKGSTIAAGVSGVAVLVGVAVLAAVSSGEETARERTPVASPRGEGPRGPLVVGPVPPRPPAPPEELGAEVREAMIRLDEAQAARAAVSAEIGEAEIALMNAEARREMLQAAVQRVDDDEYLVVTQLLAQLTNPTELMSGARFVPLTTDGRPSGFKVFAIKKDSWIERFGLVNGDAIKAVNDLPLSDEHALLALEPQLRDAAELRVKVERNGAEKILTYRITR